MATSNLIVLYVAIAVLLSTSSASLWDPQLESLKEGFRQDLKEPNDSNCEELIKTLKEEFGVMSTNFVLDEKYDVEILPGYDLRVMEKCSQLKGNTLKSLTG